MTKPRDPNNDRDDEHYNDLRDQRFGRLLVLGLTSRATEEVKQTTWTCRCDCGVVREGILYGSLVSGRAKSCGCLRREKLRARAGGKSRHSREYAAWQQAKTACFNPRHASYATHGAVGVGMCEEWRVSFEAFLRDMGKRPEGASLAVVRPEIGFGPGGCAWV